MSATVAHATSPDDLAAVQAMFRAYAASLDFDLGFQDFEAEMAGFPGKYVGPAGALLLARVDGEPVGAVGLRDLGDGVCEMKRLYLAPAARGRGVGVKLIELLIETARAAGYKAMRLDTIPGHHDAAIGLYQRFGFRDIDAYCENPFPDARFMELRL